MGSSSSFFQETNNTPATIQTAVNIVAEAQAAATQAQASASAILSVETDSWLPTMNLNWTGYNVQRVTLAGNTTFTFTGGSDGARLILELTQDATGGRTITLPSNVHYGSTISAIFLSTAPGKKDRLGFIYNATSQTYDLVGVVYGY